MVCSCVDFGVRCRSQDMKRDMEHQLFTLNNFNVWQLCEQTTNDFLNLIVWEANEKDLLSLNGGGNDLVSACSTKETEVLFPIWATEYCNLARRKLKR